MGTPARRRLLKDLRKIQNDPPNGVSACPVAENVMHWQAVIFGSVNCCQLLFREVASGFVCVCVCFSLCVVCERKSATCGRVCVLCVCFVCVLVEI